MYPIQIRTYSRGIKGCFALFLLLTGISLYAQPNTSVELKKPQQYESRTLASERTGEKKFSLPRRLYNNTVSRFNYYFNANNKLVEIIEKAKAATMEDYTQLLPFYKYSLDVTKKDHLDSVIDKCTAGILLHDLRSDWVDKLYLLMGKAYLLRKNFDSAATVFQYINYAFAPKDDGYDIPIGSNASNTNGVFTIATKESKNLWKKITSYPPARNESFLLQARNYIEQEQYTEASSLLELLHSDPNFPHRLQNALHEMMAYVLYKQQAWESSAIELTKALVKPDNKAESPRWQYLAGQLFAMANKESEALTAFENSIRHTTDPIMEIYARLNMVSLTSGSQENAIQKNLDELLKMARRDKYEGNRDIIYYAAAELELKRKNYTGAQNLLLKSIQYNYNNPLQKQLSFLLLGDLNYTRKSYPLAYAFYDSIQVPMLKAVDQVRVKERLPALRIISENIATISKEDSLQKLAFMSPELRNATIKKILKQLRKEKGLKDIEANDPNYGNNANAGLFGSPGPAGGNEFYFLNPTIRSKGFTEFKSQWGNRPNVDNWRRQSAVDRAMNTVSALKEQKTGAAPADDKELSFDALYKNIPLNAVQRDSSNTAIIRSLLGNGLTFQNKLEDYPSAIQAYEELLRRFPECGAVEQTLFNLAYCYRKNGQPDKADNTADLLTKSFSGGKYAKQLLQAKTPKKTDPAQEKYESVYRMFIEGRFEEAKEAKIQADKQFGKNYWTPQLLYIESIYYVKQRQDSAAINRLQSITGLFPKSPLAERAQTMIDVLRKRGQIESYLAYLQVERKEDAVTRGVDLDSTNPQTGVKIRRFTPFKAPTQLDPIHKELVNISDLNTIAAAVPAAPKTDSGLIIPKTGARSLNLDNNAKAETIRTNNFSFNPADTQYVVIILEKVDPIFISEGRNAFNRFNQERFPGQRIDMRIQKINDDNQFLLFGPFVNASEAVTYIDRTRPLASTRIVPWLTADKYSFSIISNANMQSLLKTQDLAGYRAFMHQVFPDKF